MKNYKLVLILLLLSTSAYAQDFSDLTISEMFTPLPGDVSIKMLQYIFGGTGAIEALSGMPENELITGIFKILNAGVLFIAGILLSYTVYTTAIRTAQDAGMSQMGRLTPMTIFRIFTGLTIMSPIPNIGFSSIQLGILWAAAHGIGFADTVYMAFQDIDKTVQTKQDQIDKVSRSTDITVISKRQKLRNDNPSDQSYISKKANNSYSQGLKSLKKTSRMNKVRLSVSDKETVNFITKSNEGINSALENSIVGLDELLTSSMCLAAYSKYTKVQSIIQIDSKFSKEDGKRCPDGSNICFGTIKTPDLCGSYSVPDYMLANLYFYLETKKAAYETSYPYYDKDNKCPLSCSNRDLASLNPDKGRWYDNIITLHIHKILYPSYIENEEYRVGCTNLCAEAKDIALNAKEIILASYKEDKEPEANKPKQQDAGWIAASHKLDQITSSFKYEGEDERKNQNHLVFDQSAAIAYKFINNIAENNYKLGSDNKFSNKSVICSLLDFLAICPSNIDFVPIQIKKLVSNYTSAFLGINSTSMIERSEKANKCQEQNSPNYDGCFNQLRHNDVIVNPNFDKINAGILGYTDEARYNLFSNSPLNQAKYTGILLLTNTYNFWKQIPEQALKESAKIFVMYRRMITTIGVLSSVIQSVVELIPWAGDAIATGVDVGTSMLTTSLQMPYQVDIHNFFRYLPAAAFISIIVFFAGVLMAVWIPLLPVIIFSLAVIGWLFYVIEAMVAAPLIAVGITHPEGHDFLGQAQQSFMLVLMVFLRPVLILIGLITAVGIFHAAIYLFNIGFLSFVSYTFTESANFYEVSKLFVMLLIYSLIFSAIAQMCFSNIFRVVERINIWIGGQPEQSPISQIVGKIKGDIMQKTQQIGQGASISISGSNVKTEAGKKGESSRGTPMSEKTEKAKGKGTTGA